MKLKRNAPCPCGSGRKYKHCCLLKNEIASPRKKLLTALTWAAVAGITVFGAVSIIQAMRNIDDTSSVQRVWSEEHQHWHYVR
jgi:hypothetical protein